MASKWYNNALNLLLKGDLDLDSGCKLVLVTSSYSFDAADDYLDMGDSGDVSSLEAGVASTLTNYTAGFGGAGRKPVVTTVTLDDSLPGAHVSLADTTWTALGGAANNTLGGVVVCKEDTNDAASPLIAFLDFTDTATNGSDITLDFNASGADGNLRLTAT